LHGIFRRADALVGFDLSDAEFYRSSTEIVDTNDENRPPVGLQLPGRGSNKNE